MFRRLLTPRIDSSFFLFGPRGSGKSSLLHVLFQSIPPDQVLWLDLLDADNEEKYSKQPSRLREEVLAKHPALVVIDEVQKVPKLLDHVQGLMESTRTRFIMTGSSARKLKRGAGNLLAGRAFVYELDPFVSDELGEHFDLRHALEMGLLPKLYQPSIVDSSVTWDREQKELYLKAYTRTYLKEEIQLEQEVRQIQAFRNFLEIAAQMNGKILNYSKISRDVGVDDKTIFNYFKILEDTLLGYFLEPYHRSVRKRQSEAPKFYFFDTGIKRALDKTLEIPLLPQTTAFGDAFEHFILLEIFKKNKVLGKEFSFSYLRTKDGAEIDLIIEKSRQVLFICEIKSAVSVHREEVGVLTQFKQDFSQGQALVLSNEPRPRRIGDVMIYPWKEGISEVFKGG